MSGVISTILASTFWGRFYPQNRIARKITLLMLLPVGLAYLGRIYIHLWLQSERGPFGSMWWIICPVVCFIAVGLVASILVLAIITVRSAEHYAPAFVLLGGIAVVPFLPLPPLPTPVFPEEEFFRTHRAEFEQVVMLARQDDLQCFWFGCDESSVRILPTEFSQLSNEGRISVYHERQSNGLVLRFSPFTWYYPIVYFEIPEDRNLGWNHECHGDGSGHVRKMDEHWYVCVEDWN